MAKLTIKHEGEKAIVTVAGYEDNPIEVAISDLTSDILTKATLYGITTKLSRAGAGKDGQDLFDAIQRTAEALKAGEWNVKPDTTQKQKDMIFQTLALIPDKGIRRQVVTEMIAKGGCPVTIEEVEAKGLI